jgi:hypothetical protein
VKLERKLECKLQRLLAENHFKLAREDKRGNRIFRNPSRRVFAMSTVNTLRYLRDAITDLENVLANPPRAEILVIPDFQKTAAQKEVERQKEMKALQLAAHAKAKELSEAAERKVEADRRASAARKGVADVEKEEERAQIESILSAWQDRKKHINDQYRATFLNDVQKAVRDYDSIAKTVRPGDIHLLQLGRSTNWPLPFELVAASKAAGMSSEKARDVLRRFIAVPGSFTFVTSERPRGAVGGCWTYEPPRVSNKTDEVIRGHMTKALRGKPSPLQFSTLSPGDESDVIDFLKTVVMVEEARPFREGQFPRAIDVEFLENAVVTNGCAR